MLQFTGYISSEQITSHIYTDIHSVTLFRFAALISYKPQAYNLIIAELPLQNVATGNTDLIIHAYCSSHKHNFVYKNDPVTIGPVTGQPFHGYWSGNWSHERQ